MDQPGLAYSPRVLLTIIIVAYLTLGVLYAALTPTWQVPDEPAHYNYVRSLAEGRGIPVLEVSDYDQALIGQLTAQRFPPELSVDPVAYEDHQPPLYYFLATPVYLFFDGAMLPLRLLSVLLGAAVLVVAFGTVQTVFPTRPGLALSATAFIAFIPQHIAMMAGVNNDSLAELVVGATLWALVIYVTTESGRPWTIGFLLGVVLLAKTTAYVVLGVAVIAVVIRWWGERRTWRWAAGQMLWMLVPALLISAPWFIRNGAVYGWRDPLGFARHEVVVAGQPRSAEWLAEYGWTGLLSRLARTTFQSFWGQFGWMGVVLPARIYLGLALLCALLLAGFLWWLFDKRRAKLGTSQRAGLALLLASSSCTLLVFLWYNLSFVQHQGRYLFPALIPYGTGVALGLNALTGRLPGRARSWPQVALFAGLAVFGGYCLFAYIIPFLAR